jgi:hypothetical protein
MASSLARLGAALPRARPRSAALGIGASRRAAPNGKSKLPTHQFLCANGEGEGDWGDRRAVLTHEISCDQAGCFDRT